MLAFRGQEFRGAYLDIDDTGVAMLLRHHVTRGSEVGLAIVLPGEKCLLCLGEVQDVTRTANGFVHRIDFSGLQPEQHAEIAAFLHELRARAQAEAAAQAAATTKAQADEAMRLVMPTLRVVASTDRTDGPSLRAQRESVVVRQMGPALARIDVDLDIDVEDEPAFVEPAHLEEAFAGAVPIDIEDDFEWITCWMDAPDEAANDDGAAQDEDPTPPQRGVGGASAYKDPFGPAVGHLLYRNVASGPARRAIPSPLELLTGNDARPPGSARTSTFCSIADDI